MKEFKETSVYGELLEIASDRNSEVLEGIRYVAPSVHRVVKLRGRPPFGRDVEDILYDLNDFGDRNVTKDELTEHLGNFTLAEATYYRLAENLAVNTAGCYGLTHRVEDLIDLAKDAVGGVVWKNWKPENGEDFTNLHKRVVSVLRHYLIHLWERGYRSRPFSSFEDYVLDKAKEANLVDGGSPEEKPIHRLRRATTILPLPAIIARIDQNQLPIEKISALALLGYYPNGRGFTGVASELGVKRDTLSSALDRVIISFRESDVSFPSRSIKEIVGELRNGAVMKYPSGKNVEFDSPRLRLLRLPRIPEGWGPIYYKVWEMTMAKVRNVFTYSLDEIARANGCSRSKASKIINKLAGARETGFQQPLDTAQIHI